MSTVPSLRILFLAEGDPESLDCWSGSARFVVEQLRAAGHTVICGDVELYGLRRWGVALASFGWPRRRWWVRFHLCGLGFSARSSRATALVRRHESEIDVVMQVGASFDFFSDTVIPRALYCDSNISMSLEGSVSGQSEAAQLTSREIDEIREREAKVYERANVIFTMSERLRGSFITDFGIPYHRVVPVWAGANFDSAAIPTAGTAIEQGHPSVLFVGRAFSRKGGPVLLAAFSRVRQAVPNATLRIIGPDEPPSGLAADGVEFLGFLNKSNPDHQAKLLAAYSSATVFCLPTRFEPFGVVFLEAMHYGLPCIGPRAWAVPEIIEDGVTGLLAEPDDPEDLARVLIELLSNPARARSMGGAGRRRLAERFSWAHVIERMEPELLAVASHASRAGA